MLAIGFLEDADLPQHLGPPTSKVAVTISELGQMTRLHRVTAQRLVSRLRQKGLIFEDQNGVFRIILHKLEQMNRPPPRTAARVQNIRFLDL